MSIRSVQKSGDLPPSRPIAGQPKAKGHHDKIHSDQVLSMEGTREISHPSSKLKAIISRIGHAVRRIFKKLFGVHRDTVQKNDECASPKEDAVNFDRLVLAKDKKKLKAEVNQAMKKIQDVIVNGETFYSEQLRLNLEGIEGRDKLHYAPISGHSKDLLGLLQSWNGKKWSLEDTVGLLMDVALNLKEEIGSDKEDLLSSKMMRARGPKGEHTVNLKATWVEDLEEFGVDKKKGLKTGPSMSTAFVLRLLRRLKVTTDEENEAIVNALVLFWKNSLIKHARGEYHTTVEVWAAYTHHLEKVHRRRRRRAEEM